jgi:hypothetical protein
MTTELGVDTFGMFHDIITGSKNTVDQFIGVSRTVRLQHCLGMDGERNERAETKKEQPDGTRQTGAYLRKAIPFPIRTDDLHERSEVHMRCDLSTSPNTRTVFQRMIQYAE